MKKPSFKYVIANISGSISNRLGNISNVSLADAVNIQGLLNKTMRLSGTPPVFYVSDLWEDLRIVPGAFQYAGNADPTMQPWQPGGEGRSFLVYKFNQGQVGYFAIQLPHSYKEGTSMYAHAHWTPGDRGVAEADNTVAWKLDYSWANVNGIFLSSQTADLTSVCSGDDDRHEITTQIEIPGSDKNISSMLICAFYRDSDDTWEGTGANGPALLEVDFHFNMDTPGSSNIVSK